MQDAIIACPCCGQNAAVKRPLVSLDDNTIAWRGRLSVTGQRAEILSILAGHFGNAVSHDTIISKLHGAGDEPMDALNGVCVQVSYLRKVLPRIGLTIKTVWGRGYALVEHAEAVHAAA